MSTRSQSPLVRAHLRSIAHAGGKAGGGVRRAAAAQRWDRDAAGMTPGQIAKAFYRRGYSNGAGVAYRRGVSDGYEQGYEAALRDSRWQKTRQTPQDARSGDQTRLEAGRRTIMQ